ncbi:monooxygenase [Roseomonas sp. KE2513]|uniref:FAD-dependent monooxygenase n=1 Tax=Roseomonas sp. KE2513 TaxID=2479202 RepID=UPI0018DEF1A1|nr:FAD-dependent monooxygenase [Roseomonas sp. KE2513]MBI0533964.1 monooxygenase [Roseomonas sp. KE2513]
MSPPPVLVVGAGPTGLNMALRLAQHGVPFRLIDQHEAPAQESRALAVHARTLEYYRQLGLAEALVAAGTEVQGIRMHEGGQERAYVDIKDIGRGLSPYPFILDLPQDEHEHLLVAWLRERGVEVERATSLLSFTQGETGVEASISTARGHAETARFDYLLGCDGARSKVREGMGTGFDGGTYQHLYYVADVRLDIPNRGRDVHLATGPETFALRLPARKGDMERLIGFVPDGIEQPTFETVRGSAEHLLGVKVAEVNWFSTYRVHHRVASSFREGRAFLLGDAGHLHSPVGGQGMNTGIGDAVNLSWKLAEVLLGRAPPTLLDTYEPERIAFARELVATTDRMFRAVVAEGFAGSVFRTTVMPMLVPAATHFAAGRRALFRFASQIRIRYPGSALSEGRAGDIAGGDRLPWADGPDNFAPLTTLDWHVQVHGEAHAALAAEAEELSLPLHRFDWSDGAERAGFARGAAYLVRPDGHIALAMEPRATGRLRAYARKHGLRFGRSSAPPLSARG